MGTKTKIGEIYTTNKYGDFIVTKYVNFYEVHIKFINTGYERIVSKKHISSGEVRDRFFKSVYGVGVVGDETTRGSDGKKLKEYRVWNKMLCRCYNEDFHKKQPSYTNCTASENFKYYPFFKDWCNNQIGFGNEGWQLDKDILIKGNKIYSEDTCCFVPPEINSLFIKCDRSRGEYPLGVNYHKASGKFAAQINIKMKRVHLGLFDTIDEAFLAYKMSKESQIKELANKYKDFLDSRVYNAMMMYEVNHDD